LDKSNPFPFKSDFRKGAKFLTRGFLDQLQVFPPWAKPFVKVECCASNADPTETPPAVQGLPLPVSEVVYNTLSGKGGNKTIGRHLEKLAKSCEERWVKMANPLCCQIGWQLLGIPGHHHSSAKSIGRQGSS